MIPKNLIAVLKGEHVMGDLSSTAVGSSKAILKNEVVLPKTEDTYTEIRHIMLKGTNYEIGKALADIAQSHYQSKLIPFRSELFKKARNKYMQEKYPILFERMKGIASSYNLTEKDLLDTSCLVFDIVPSACSAVYFPKYCSANGHSFVARTSDFYATTINEFMGMDNPGTGNKLLSRDFVLELYPDKGYASIVLGTFDLLSGSMDAMNSEGLTISVLADDAITDHMLAQFDDQAGLSSTQLVRAILDTAKDIKEAEAIVRDNIVYMPIDTVHFIIGDRSGNSVVVEFADEDLSPRFTPGNQKPQIMTNHPVYLYPNISDFPEVPADKTYDTFNRYRTLYNFLQKNDRKYTFEDGFEALSQVYGFCNDRSEGAAHDLPLRTIWPIIMDLDDLSMVVKFYEKDGPDNTLLFSQPYKFQLDMANCMV